MTTQLILRPITDNSVQWSITGGGEHAGYVDEVVADDADYIAASDFSNATFKDLFAYADHTTESGTINSVKIYARCKYVQLGSSTTPHIHLCPTSSVEGTAQNVTTSWAVYTQTWTTNPADSAAWEWADIDALVAGIVGTVYGAGDFVNWNYIWCSQFYIEVDYGDTFVYKDITSRFALVAAAYKDITSRFAIEIGAAVKDITSRFGLRAEAYKDIVSRFKLSALAYTDIASRFKLMTGGWQTVASRFKIYGVTWKDIVSHFVLTQPTSFKNITSRFALDVKKHIIFATSGYGVLPRLINRVMVIGVDADSNLVYGEAKDVTINGEMLDPITEAAITNTTDANTVAANVLAKERLNTNLGQILINPNCGVEQWDPIAIRDKWANQGSGIIGANYRVAGWSLSYQAYVAGVQNSKYEMLIDLTAI
jgi:hypothetical protein